MALKYKRILLKISGEALGGEKGMGFDEPTMDAIQAAAGDDVCAVLVELVQGEGGVNPLDQEFVTALDQLCHEKDWLLLCDEVQCGLGRTGSLFIALLDRFRSSS